MIWKHSAATNRAASQCLSSLAVNAVWSGKGVDFLHLSLVPSPLFTKSDSGVILKFNYTEAKESFEVGAINGGVPIVESALIAESHNTLSGTPCKNSEYFH